MPIFEYICKECQHQFEALVYGKEKAECPKCHTKIPGFWKRSTSKRPSDGHIQPLL